ncbi:hypothetical protein PsYK624_080110 [Phanerochaete sordida]|uniref:RING-type domain-containing protein n=1 Tax=Phanerochaete sordida TaxID=48140 RepID=A0A9P3GDK8_9APHY|nr:hypothetical protein PsYK624_080110 [Phanerochaete sordida]
MEERVREDRRREDERRREEEERNRQAEIERRRAQEHARQQAETQRRHEEQRARREAEQSAKREEQNRIDAARTITDTVDNCIVTFSAGLAVEAIIASFEVTRGRIMGLPQGVQARDIIALFERQGLARTSFAVGKAYRSNCAFISIDTSLVPHLDDLPPLQAVTLRFTPFKNSLADDGSGATAFGRTVSFQVVQRSSDPITLLTALETHLLQLPGVPRARSVRRERLSGGGDGRTSFSAEFDTWENARMFRDRLHGDRAFRLGGIACYYNRLFLPSKYSYPIFVSTPQYNVQKAQWDELAEACREARCELKVRNMPDGKVRLNLHGDVLEQVGPLKVRAEQLAQGTTINMWNRRLFDQATGQKLTDDLRDTTGALVEVDRRIKALRAYGPTRAVERAREQLEFYAEELAQKEYVKELTAQRTVRFFVEVGYPQLKETYGEDMVTLDLVSTPRKITVTGDEEIRHRLDRLFAESFSEWTSTSGTADVEHTCPICMCPATAPSALGCGHVYCTECLTHFVRSALEGDAFPLRCSGDEGRCGAPLAIAVLERFLHAGRFQQLLEAAFHAHIAQHPDTLRPCRTAGCTQLYAPLAARVAVQCPACFTRACGACGRAPHAGQSCEDAARDPSEAYLASAASGVRRCPRCAVPVFKDGGCQHVACRCGAHVCWRCLAAFDASDACYAHMGAAHGGIYEEDMEAAERRGHVARPEPAIPAEFVEEDRLARLQAGLEARPAPPVFVRRQQEVQARREAEYNAWAMDYNRRWGEDQGARADDMRRRREEAARRETERAEAERARQQRGGWCVVM